MMADMRQAMGKNTSCHTHINGQQDASDNSVADLLSLHKKLAEALAGPPATFSKGNLQHHPRAASQVTSFAPDWKNILKGPPGLMRTDSSESLSTSFESFQEEEDEWSQATDMAEDPFSNTWSKVSLPHAQGHNQIMPIASMDESPTTMMIRNIPSNYTQNDLMADLKDLGLAATYDFLYVPVDRRTGANVGYAFVNFTSPVWAERCMLCFGNFDFSTGKRAKVVVAHLQGFERNLQHCKQTQDSRGGSHEKFRRPVVVAHISDMISQDSIDETCGHEMQTISAPPGLLVYEYEESL
jgi:hypothetical protein